MRQPLFSSADGSDSLERGSRVLTGNLADFRECHIEPDWLLIYQVFEDVLILSATATGTHAELFDESCINESLPHVKEGFRSFIFQFVN